MEDQNDQRPLTAEEKEANSIIEKSNTRVAELNKDIENLHSGKGPEPRPLGFGSNRGMDFRTRETLRIKNEINTVRQQADKELDELVDRTPGRTKYHVHEIVDQHRNPEKTLDERRMEAKDITESQDLTMRYVAIEKSRRDEPVTSNKKEAPIDQQTPPEKAPEPPMNRFTQSLSFTQKYTPGDRDNLEIKSKEKERDMDRDDR